MVALGVADLARARRFSEQGLGWKRADDPFWGGCLATSPTPTDRHLWEVAWEPHALLADDGSIRLPRRARGANAARHQASLTTSRGAGSTGKA
jgi:hypothetical protein